MEDKYYARLGIINNKVQIIGLGGKFKVKDIDEHFTKIKEDLKCQK